MKRIKLCTHDMMIQVDSVPLWLSAAQWFAIKLDDHIDYLSWDQNTGGEIQWCPNAHTGRMPPSEKFPAGSWSSYCDQALLDRAVAAYAQREAEVKAEADAIAHQLAEAAKVKA